MRLKCGVVLTPRHLLVNSIFVKCVHPIEVNDAVATTGGRWSVERLI